MPVIATNHLSPQKITKRALAVFLVLASVAMAGLIFFGKFPFPYGWDAGYYYNQIQNIPTHPPAVRVGYIYSAYLIHLLTGISIVKLQVILPFTLLVLFCLWTSLLIRRLFRTDFSFVFAFALLLLSNSYTYFAIGLYDNLFGLMLMSLIFFLATGTWMRTHRTGPLVLFCLFSLLGISHLETYAFTVAIAVLFLSISYVPNFKNITAWMRTAAWLSIPLVGSAVSVFLVWKAYGLTVIKSYTTIKSSTDDASVSYFQQSSAGLFSSLTNFFHQHSQLWQFGLAGIAMLIGFIWLIRHRFSRTNPAGTFFISWAIAGYALFGLAVVRSSVPINRALPMFPFLPLVIIGLLYILTKLPVRKFIAIFLFLVMFMPSLVGYALIIDQTLPAVPATTFQDTTTLHNDIRKQLTIEPDAAVVILTNTPSYEPAASAFYFMWWYWINGSIADISGLQYCIYFGEPSDILTGDYGHIRTDNAEYTAISKQSAQCLNNIPKPSYLYAIESFGKDDFQYIRTQPGAVLISSRVVRLPL